MRDRQRPHTCGFTIVELLVVIGIIAMMIMIVLASIAQAQKSSRDKNRVADLNSIKYALTIYKQAHHDALPENDEGVQTGIGSSLDDILQQYMGKVYKDPKQGASVSGDFGYYYDSDFACTREHQHVLFARTMERSKDANFNKVCTSSSVDTSIAGENSFIIVVNQFE